MKPVNSKSLFAHLCETMDRLDKDEIDVAKAATQAKLVGQCVNLMNYELKRAIVIEQMQRTNSKEVVRNVELKSFDSLPQ